jgi:hypothetical protein
VAGDAKTCHWFAPCRPAAADLFAYLNPHVAFVLAAASGLVNAAGIKNLPAIDERHLVMLLVAFMGEPDADDRLVSVGRARNCRYVRSVEVVGLGLR